MMQTLEQHVTSLELSKRLKELGLNQESLFYWADGSIVTRVEFEILLDDGKIRSLSGVYNSWPDQDVFELCSAFLSSELCLLLPCNIGYYDLQINPMPGLNRVSDKYEKYYRVRYLSLADLSFHVLAESSDFNEANARAKMLIHLIEKNIIEVPK